MAEDLEIQNPATPTNNNTLSPANDSDSTWNYIWDDKLCKTTLKLLKTSVFTPPILSLPLKDRKLPFVCPAEGCNLSFKGGSQFRVHMKRHLPNNEKPFKCDQPSCTKAFVRYDELKVHKRTHTGEKPFECEQCGKKFSRNHHLRKHLNTHIKKTKMNIDSSSDVSSEELGDDNSDASNDSESDDSSTSSLDLDVPVKEEIVDSDTNEEDHRHEIEKIKVETKKINDPGLADFFSSDLRVEIRESKIQETGGGHGANDFKFNEKLSSSLVPIKLDMPVTQKIHTKKDEFGNLIELNLAMKQELKTETTLEYDKRFEEFVLKELKDEAELVAEPTSMTAAINHLTNPIQISENKTKSKFYEMEKIKVETKKINDPGLADFFSSDLRVEIRESKIQETGGGPGANDFKLNDTSSSSLVPIKLDMPVKRKIRTKKDEFGDPIELNLAMKQELKTEATLAYDKRFEEFVLKELKDEAEMVAETSTEPTSMTTAIHSLANPIQISANNSESESTKLKLPVKQESDTKSSNDYDHRFEEFVMNELKEEPDMIAQPDSTDLYSSHEPTSMSAAIHRLAFPIPIAANIIKSESNLKNHKKSKNTNIIDLKSKNNIQPKSKPKNIMESESKVTEKRHKCSVDGCDKAFSMPYGLKRHSWVHTKVKTFECKQCEKKFLRKDHLSKHLKTHSSIPIIELSSQPPQMNFWNNI